MTNVPEIDALTRRLREEFDASFAAPRVANAESRLRMLAVGIGSTAAALRVSELGGLHKDRPLASVPGGAPGLLGLAGVRGRLVAVFSLAALLELEAAEGPARYFALCAARPSVGLAFTRLEGLRELAPDRLLEAPADSQARRFAHFFADGPRPRGVVDVCSLLAAIAAAVGLEGGL